MWFTCNTDKILNDEKSFFGYMYRHIDTLRYMCNTCWYIVFDRGVWIHAWYLVIHQRYIVIHVYPYGADALTSIRTEYPTNTLVTTKLIHVSCKCGHPRIDTRVIHVWYICDTCRYNVSRTSQNSCANFTQPFCDICRYTCNTFVIHHDTGIRSAHRFR